MKMPQEYYFMMYALLFPSGKVETFIAGKLLCDFSFCGRNISAGILTETLYTMAFL